MPYGLVVTAEGRKFLAKQVAGAQLKISRVMVGSGTVPEDTNPAYLTDLIHPVAQATSSFPIAKNDTVSFIVEYRNDLNGGLQEGFWIGEFGVFVRDGENEILVYYGTLGDFPQYVMAYKNGVVDIRRYPVTVKLSEKIKVTLEYPALAFVTEERFRELIKIEAVPYLQKIIEQATIQREIVIPTTGWTGGGGGVRIEIAQDDVTEQMIPIVSIVQSDMNTAIDCGMSSVAETIEKGLRLYAEKAPSKEIHASLLLLRAYGGTVGGVTNNMDIEEFYDNYVATSEDIQETLKEVFQK